jgi:TPR repeat protein
LKHFHTHFENMSRITISAFGSDSDSDLDLEATGPGVSMSSSGNTHDDGNAMTTVRSSSSLQLPASTSHASNRSSFTVSGFDSDSDSDPGGPTVISQRQELAKPSTSTSTRSSFTVAFGDDSSDSDIDDSKLRSADREFSVDHKHREGQHLSSSTAATGSTNSTLYYDGLQDMQVPLTHSDMPVGEEDVLDFDVVLSLLEDALQSTEDYHRRRRNTSALRTVSSFRSHLEDDLKKPAMLRQFSFDDEDADFCANVVLLVGSTGAGKSTTTNYLAGYNMEERDSAAATHGSVIDIAGDGIGACTIGHGTASQTLIPTPVHIREERRNVTLVDTPGVVGENRSLNDQLVTSLSISRLIVRIPSVVRAIALVVDYKVFFVKRGADLARMYYDLNNLFAVKGGFWNLPKMPRMFFLVTHAKDHNGKLVSEQHLRDYLDELIDDLQQPNQMNAAERTRRLAVFRFMRDRCIIVQPTRADLVDVVLDKLLYGFHGDNVRASLLTRQAQKSAHDETVSIRKEWLTQQMDYVLAAHATELWQRTVDGARGTWNRCSSSIRAYEKCCRDIPLESKNQTDMEQKLIQDCDDHRQKLTAFDIETKRLEAELATVTDTLDNSIVPQRTRIKTDIMEAQATIDDLKLNENFLVWRSETLVAKKYGGVVGKDHVSYNGPRYDDIKVIPDRAAPWFKVTLDDRATGRYEAKFVPEAFRWGDGTVNTFVELWVEKKNYRDHPQKLQAARQTIMEREAELKPINRDYNAAIQKQEGLKIDVNHDRPDIRRRMIKSHEKLVADSTQAIQDKKQLIVELEQKKVETHLAGQSYHSQFVNTLETTYRYASFFLRSQQMGDVLDQVRALVSEYLDSVSLLSSVDCSTDSRVSAAHKRFDFEWRCTNDPLSVVKELCAASDYELKDKLALPSVKVAINVIAVQADQQGVPLIAQLANRDHDLALATLAECYEHGWAVSKDIPKACSLAVKAVRQRNDDAVEHLKRMAEEDMLEPAMMSLASCYYNEYGQFGLLSDEERIEHAAGLYQVALHRHQSQRAYDQLQRMSNQHGAASFMMGEVYEYGYGHLSASINEACSRYQTGVRQSEQRALAKLQQLSAGYADEKWDGSIQSDAQHTRHFAMWKLAELFGENELDLLQANNDQACKLLYGILSEAAADSRVAPHAKAQLNALAGDESNHAARHTKAMCILHGYHILQDRNHACELLHDLAASHHVQSVDVLRVLASKKEQLSHARVWLARGAKAQWPELKQYDQCGDEAACQLLVAALQHDADANARAQLQDWATNPNDGIAKYHLGCVLLNGSGIGVDFNEACECFKRAVCEDEPRALQKLVEFSQLAIKGDDQSQLQLDHKHFAMWKLAELCCEPNLALIPADNDHACELLFGILQSAPAQSPVAPHVKTQLSALASDESNHAARHTKAMCILHGHHMLQKQDHACELLHDLAAVGYMPPVTVLHSLASAETQLSHARVWLARGAKAQWPELKQYDQCGDEAACQLLVAALQHDGDVDALAQLQNWATTPNEDIAKYHLGCVLLNGWGTAPSRAEACQYFAESLTLGHKGAQLELESLANNEHDEEAMLLLAPCQANRLGVFNLWSQNDADSSSSRLLQDVIRIRSSQRGYVALETQMKRNGAATFMMGEVFFHGYGHIVVDKDKACNLFQQSVRQDEIRALHQLRSLHQSSPKVENKQSVVDDTNIDGLVDTAAAAAETAAETPDIHVSHFAAWKLAELYCESDLSLVPLDYDEACELLFHILSRAPEESRVAPFALDLLNTLAADADNLTARYNQSKCMFYGHHVQKDQWKACEIMHDLGELAYMPAISYLESLASERSGEPLSFARIWLAQGAKKQWPELAQFDLVGDEPACQLLIAALRHDSEPRAIALLRLWSQLPDNGIAKYHLARVFLHGWGADVDDVKACDSFVEAIRVGHAQAHIDLDRLGTVDRNKAAMMSLARCWLEQIGRYCDYSQNDGSENACKLLQDVVREHAHVPSQDALDWLKELSRTCSANGIASFRVAEILVHGYGHATMDFRLACKYMSRSVYQQEERALKLLWYFAENKHEQETESESKSASTPESQTEVILSQQDKCHWAKLHLAKLMQPAEVAPPIDGETITPVVTLHGTHAGNAGSAVGQGDSKQLQPQHVLPVHDNVRSCDLLFEIMERAEFDCSIAQAAMRMLLDLNIPSNYHAHHVLAKCHLFGYQREADLDAATTLLYSMGRSAYVPSIELLWELAEDKAHSVAQWRLALGWYERWPYLCETKLDHDLVESSNADSSILPISHVCSCELLVRALSRTEAPLLDESSSDAAATDRSDPHQKARTQLRQWAEIQNHHGIPKFYWAGVHFSEDRVAEACDWYRQSAESKYQRATDKLHSLEHTAPALFELGRFYQNDCKYFLRSASEHQYRPAFDILCELVEKESSNAPAKHSLGVCYENKWFAPDTPDAKRACDLFTEAVRLDYSPAYEALCDRVTNLNCKFAHCMLAELAYAGVALFGGAPNYQCVGALLLKVFREQQYTAAFLQLRILAKKRDEPFIQLALGDTLELQNEHGEEAYYRSAAGFRGLAAARHRLLALADCKDTPRAEAHFFLGRLHEKSIGATTGLSKGDVTELKIPPPFDVAATATAESDDAKDCSSPVVGEDPGHNNDPESHIELACTRYENALRLRQYPEAFERLTSLADSGELSDIDAAKAMRVLARCHHDGWGINLDLDEAGRRYAQAIRRRCERSRGVLVELADEKHEKQAQFHLALEFVHESHNLGSQISASQASELQMRASRLLFDAAVQDWPRAIQPLTNLAQPDIDGCAEAQYFVARCHHEGHSIERDEKQSGSDWQAAHFFGLGARQQHAGCREALDNMAANEHHPHAEFLVGQLHHVAGDIRTAVQWFTKASLQSHAQAVKGLEAFANRKQGDALALAKLELGRMYRRGVDKVIGVDKVHATELLHGSVDADSDGESGHEGKAAMAELLGMADEEQVPHAHVAIGLLRDDELKRFQQAAALDFAPGHWYTARCYRSGLGGAERDEKSASYHYCKAYQLGHDTAYCDLEHYTRDALWAWYYLGIIHEYGIGNGGGLSGADFEKSIRMYVAGAHKKHHPCWQRLRMLSEWNEAVEHVALEARKLAELDSAPGPSASGSDGAAVAAVAVSYSESADANSVHLGDAESVESDVDGDVKASINETDESEFEWIDPSSSSSNEQARGNQFRFWCMYGLGLCYDKGGHCCGHVPDFASLLYERAAMQGSVSNAMYELGKCYSTGYGHVPLSKWQSIKCWRKAARMESDNQHSDADHLTVGQQEACAVLSQVWCGCAGIGINWAKWCCCC